MPDEISRPGRIWILEDDADIGFVLEFFLNEEGFKTQLFPSAVRFREAVVSGLPDLFLMDVMLPDGDGVDLCLELKQDQRCRHIPVLMMSAHAGLVGVKQCQPNGFIAKPFDLEHVLDCVQEQLAGQHG
ncbi:MAG: response regulator [Bacteroidota bacterium]